MKQKNSKNEYMDVWDAGTYQTGNTTPPKKSNPLVAVLLMLVIFLGGIASALGIINLRLLAQLQQQQTEETLPIQLQPNKDLPQLGNNAALETAPSIPKADISMDLSDEAVFEKPEPETDVETIATRSLVKVQLSEDRQGYGLVLQENGYILTYAHLVNETDRILVTLPDGTVHRAALVGSDAFSDLAVLYVRVTGLTPAAFSNVDHPETGSKVTALCSSSFSGGTVFDAEKPLDICGKKLPLLQTSAATGEKAGFLFTENGQVLGVISPRIGKYLPAGVEVFRKTGTLTTGLCNDAGIVRTKQGDYAIMIFYNGNVGTREEYDSPLLSVRCDELLARISQAVWEIFSEP